MYTVPCELFLLNVCTLDLEGFDKQETGRDHLRVFAF